jgi:DNA-binding response OmpR family regulator
MATIVVADDDEDIRDLVVLKLRHGGHQVVAVEDGAAAVQACRTHRPQLAILDVMMPGTSGLDACRAIRADPDLAGLPVILLTARTQEDDLRQGVAAGADDYVVKPFSPRDLAERVTEVLRGRGTAGE